MPRTDGYDGEFRVSLGAYTLRCAPDGLPPMFDRYVEHAALVERFELAEPNRCCVAVSRGAAADWPFLVIAQSINPAGAGFEPGVLLIPEHHRLFVGAGDRIAAYDLAEPRRLWIDSAELGFWGWQRHGDIVLMSAELELAAWTVDGIKLWTTFVEPPWDYSVEGSSVTLDVMGSISSFPLRSGRG